MQKPHDNSKASPAAFMQDNTLIAVIELGLSNWLVAGLIPGVSREPLKKLEPNPEDLLKLLHGWRDEAIKAGGPITRIAVAYETWSVVIAPWRLSRPWRKGMPYARIASARDWSMNKPVRSIA